MQCPFPGLDPYLEARGRWADFHTRFLTYVCDELSASLPENYVAQMEEQVHLGRPGESRGPVVHPDVAVLQDTGPTRGGQNRLGVSLLEPVSVELETDYIEEPPHTWIEIRHLPDLDLVTLIELLSPYKKAGWDRNDFLARRLKLLKRPIHLVELDFLIEGQRLPMRGPMPAGDAFAIVSRVEARPKADVYSWGIREPLPTIAVPLNAPDPDVPLSLSIPYEVSYQRRGYWKILRYGEPLGLKLVSDDLEWTEAMARSAISQ